ncbi:hypothetical protein B7R21_12730 [Subtercola boreus]|uniref:Uncharacterized protein n=2 Tax=Subtercola boreus TaxID=120213 RepID=A0A3E0VQ29_9MICO|nr:hypothetical protein B7R21_12730 [Subtercola boreus]
MFQSGEKQRFDLIIAADAMRSSTTRATLTTIIHSRPGVSGTTGAPACRSFRAGSTPLVGKLAGRLFAPPTDKIELPD